MTAALNEKIIKQSLHWNTMLALNVICEVGNCPVWRSFLGILVWPTGAAGLIFVKQQNSWDFPYFTRLTSPPSLIHRSRVKTPVNGKTNPTSYYSFIILFETLQALADFLMRVSGFERGMGGKVTLPRPLRAKQRLWEIARFKLDRKDAVTETVASLGVSQASLVHK